MALREISKFRRRSLRNALNFSIGASVFALSNFAFVSSTFAQLRTGRSTDREFYTPNEPKPDVPSKAANKRTKSDVVQASANEVIFDEETPVRQSKRSQSAVRHASGEHPTSRVVQAGCKSCQAGVAHSHPIAATQSQIVVDEEESIDSGLSEVVQDPNAMVYGSTWQPRMTGAETGILIYTPPILGNILGRMQLRIEAATFWPEGQNLPQLVAVTAAPAGPPIRSLFGGSEVLGDSTQGLRGEIGTFFDPSGRDGVLLRFFSVGSNSLSYNSTPDSEPVVMRPFNNTLLAGNVPGNVAINFPNSSLILLDGTVGTLNATISSDVYGGDILFRKLILRDPAGRLEFLGGYQNARLAERLFIDSRTIGNRDSGTAGFENQLTDRFQTINRFNGMALGLNGVLRERNWSLSGMVKLGLGNMERNVTINGDSVIQEVVNPGNRNAITNGLLARNTNDGNYIDNTFVVTPETNLTLGYRLTPRLEVTVGYTYLGLPKVARVADQLDPNLASNLSTPPSGPSTPTFSLTDGNYALHSLDYGLQWRY